MLRGETCVYVCQIVLCYYLCTQEERMLLGFRLRVKCKLNALGVVAACTASYHVAHS